MKRVRSRRRPRAAPREPIPMLPVFLAFVSGAAAVTLLLHSGSGAIDVSFLAWQDGSLWALFSSCVIFLAAVCFAATSTLGTALIPACAAVCGGSIAYQSATIISAVDAVTARQVVMTVIIPALLLVPPFFVVSRGGLRLSGLLRAGADRKVRSRAAGGFAVQALLAFALAFAAAAYLNYLHPA